MGLCSSIALGMALSTDERVVSLDGDGSLLDHSVVLYGSAMHGNNHDPNELPIVLLGSGGGRLKMGQWLQCSEGTPLANLWLTYAQLMGVSRERFADSTGPLKNALV